MQRRMQALLGEYAWDWKEGWPRCSGSSWLAWAITRRSSRWTRPRS